MSCFADFENFSDYFVRAAKYIINDASRNPVILPAYPTMLTPAEYCLGKNSKQLIAKGFFGDVQISTYEYYSLQLLLKGNSYKEIGRILSVSHKTIEKYLSNFKRQTGYNPRDISFVQESDGIVEFICAIKGNSEKVV